MNLLSLIPSPSQALIVIALIVIAFMKGMSYEQDMNISKQAVRTVTVAKRQAAVTVRVVTKYVDRIEYISAQGAEIIKEVPVYVTKEDDARCVVPDGFVSLHDAAAANRIPGAAGETNAQASGIALSTVATTVAENYERCHKNSAQLEALQEWVREQGRATNE